MRGAVATRLHETRTVFHNYTYAWPLPLDATAMCLVEAGEVSSHFSGVYAPPPEGDTSGQQSPLALPAQQQSERGVTELRAGRLMLASTAQPVVAKQWGGNRNIPLAMLVGGVAWLGWEAEAARGALETLRKLQKDIPRKPSCLLELSLLAMLHAVRSRCAWWCVCGVCMHIFHLLLCVRLRSLDLSSQVRVLCVCVCVFRCVPMHSHHPPSIGLSQ